LQVTLPVVRGCASTTSGPAQDGTKRRWRPDGGVAILRRMKKRVLAAILWFYAMWYAGAMIAQVFGLSAALGPILGTASAAIIAVDPRHIIWTKSNRTTNDSAPAASQPAPTSI